MIVIVIAPMILVMIVVFRVALILLVLVMLTLVVLVFVIAFCCEGGYGKHQSTCYRANEGEFANHLVFLCY